MPHPKHTLRAIYSVGFIFAMHAAVVAYIDSSFLDISVGEKYVGVIYAIGAILSILALDKIASFLGKFGNFKTAIFLFVMEIASLIGLAFIKSGVALAAVYALHYALLSLLAFNLDIFLEHFSKDARTGNIRGTYFTFVNIAWVISPFIVGSILTDSDFWKIYLLAAIVLIPVIIIISSNLKNIKEAAYKHPRLWQTLDKVRQKKDIRNIFAANFILQFFFAWMVIYMPIYLNRYIGLDWSKIGIIFTIMLLPYILFDFPLGKLADEKLGEKEILIAGFAVMAISTMAISFIASANVVIWAIILFITRIGASFIDMMSETYFFKKVDETDTDIIGFFRNARPISYIIAPLAATIFLSLFEYKYLFLFLGIISLVGIKYSLRLHDTK